MLDLSPYQECLEKVRPDSLQNLDHIIQNAERHLTAEGLKQFLDGAKSLCDLGRGNRVVIAYLETVPTAVQTLDESIIKNIMTAALTLSTNVSGEIVAHVFCNLPTACRRLGSTAMLRSFLTFLNRLAEESPRSLRPMLDHTDELLAKLTLSGLENWAFYGVKAYRRDYRGLVKYFNLETVDSISMLEKQRHGILYINIHRKLRLFLRALWKREFEILPFDAHKKQAPYIVRHTLYLPDAADAFGPINGLDLYRAQATHVAAHLVYSNNFALNGKLSKTQKFLIGFMEDARIEYSAIREFPGLRKNWQLIIETQLKNLQKNHALSPLLAIALCMLNPSRLTQNKDYDCLIQQWRRQVSLNPDDSTTSLTFSNALYDLLTEQNNLPDVRLLQNSIIAYRDDNRHIWTQNTSTPSPDNIKLFNKQNIPGNNIKTSDSTHLIEEENQTDISEHPKYDRLSRNPHNEVIQNSDENNNSKIKPPHLTPYHYQEWDYQIQSYRPDWATVYEPPVTPAKAQGIDSLLKQYKPIAKRIQLIIDMFQQKNIQRIRNLEDGDEIDTNAAIDAMIAIRMKEIPDARISKRNISNQRDLCVLVLLDLSESTNQLIPKSKKTILDLTREASTLLSIAIDGIGDPFAIHGFASNGRHNVMYSRFKNFKDAFNDVSKARLMAMRGGLSTRMGTALRHASRFLLEQPESKKLLLIISDGEPADIDEIDPLTLQLDAQKAAEELRAHGILPYCLALDSEADNYVKAIFGANNYTIMDDINNLPKILPALFARLTY